MRSSDTASVTIASRLICRSSRNDTPIMATIAGAMKTIWRMTK
jgi:hypothetical protein